MLSFAFDYFLFIFFASFGIVQFAASKSGLASILIFRSPKLSRIIGITLIVISAGVFFLTDNRNINDYEGGLDANQQAYLFVLASFASLVATMAIGSIRVLSQIRLKNHSLNGPFHNRNSILSSKFVHPTSQFSAAHVYQPMSD